MARPAKPYLFHFQTRQNIQSIAFARLTPCQERIYNYPSLGDLTTPLAITAGTILGALCVAQSAGENPLWPLALPGLIEAYLVGDLIINKVQTNIVNKTSQHPDFEISAADFTVINPETNKRYDGIEGIPTTQHPKANPYTAARFMLGALYPDYQQYFLGRAWPALETLAADVTRMGQAYNPKEEFMALTHTDTYTIFNQDGATAFGVSGILSGLQLVSEAYLTALATQVQRHASQAQILTDDQATLQALSASQPWRPNEYPPSHPEILAVKRWLPPP